MEEQFSVQALGYLLEISLTERAIRRCICCSVSCSQLSPMLSQCTNIGEARQVIFVWTCFSTLLFRYQTIPSQKVKITSDGVVDGLTWAIRQVYADSGLEMRSAHGGIPASWIPWNIFSSNNLLFNIPKARRSGHYVKMKTWNTKFNIHVGDHCARIGTLQNEVISSRQVYSKCTKYMCDGSFRSTYIYFFVFCSCIRFWYWNSNHRDWEAFILYRSQICLWFINQNHLTQNIVPRRI